jgi:hypothetical protein
MNSIHGGGGSSSYLCLAAGLDADYNGDDRQGVLVLHVLTGEEALGEIAGGKMPASFTGRPAVRSSWRVGGPPRGEDF